MDQEPLEPVRKMDAHALEGLAELGLARHRAVAERNIKRAGQVAQWMDRMDAEDYLMVLVSRDDLRAILDDRGDASETRFPAAAARLRERLGFPP